MWGEDTKCYVHSLFFFPPDTEPLAFFWETWKNWCHCNLATSVPESVAKDFALQVQDCSSLTVPGSSCGESRNEGYRGKTPRSLISIPRRQLDWSHPTSLCLDLIVTDSETCSDKLCMCVTLWSHTLRFLAQLYMSLMACDHVPINTNMLWNTAPRIIQWNMVPIACPIKLHGRFHQFLPMFIG
jgi:hypothetical protein